MSFNELQMKIQEYKIEEYQDEDDFPSVEQLQAEFERVKYKRRYKRVLRSTVYILIVVAALAVLVATLWMPVLQIYGTSMDPTLSEGDIVISVKSSEFAILIRLTN